MPIVYILDDDPALCESLGFLLDSVAIPYKTFNTPAAFLAEDYRTIPSCLLLDIRMPEMNGLRVQDHLIKIQPQLPIIFMTGHGNIHMAVDAMKKGAIDFFVKPFNHQLLLKSIQKAFKKSRKQLTAEETQLDFSQLTEQEESIIQHIIAGESSKRIAHRSGLSIKTIEYHRTKIFRKLRVKNVVELTRLYMLKKPRSHH